MHISAQLFVVATLTTLAVPTTAQDQKHSTLAPRIVSAKSVYFDDQSGVAAVGDKTLHQLKRWGRFQVVQDRKRADLIILLSAQQYNGGYLIVSGGQTGTIQDGHIEMDRVPKYNKPVTARYAYLTVIDPTTGESLWSDSHPWGGLLTGFNSAGERLINRLKKEIEK